MLDFYAREKQSAADSLAASLQKPPPRITKASVRQDSSISSNKSFVSRFIQDHPEIIEKYRAKLRQEPNPIDFAKLSGKADVDDHLIAEMLKKLDQLPAGPDHAQTYQDLISECLLFVFDWYLKRVEHGRIDIRSETSARSRLSMERLHAPAILMENENGPLSNQTLQQFAERLSLEAGLFGFLFCRTIAKPEEIKEEITKLFTTDEKCILVFDDHLIHNLVERRRSLGYKGVESLLHKMVHLVMYGEEIYQVLYGADQLPGARDDKKP